MDISHLRNILDTRTLHTCTITATNQVMKTKGNQYMDRLLQPTFIVFPQGFKTSSLTSMELQMLTSSCVKLQTVHHIPLSINKEGRVLMFAS